MTKNKIQTKLNYNDFYSDILNVARRSGSTYYEDEYFKLMKRELSWNRILFKNLINWCVNLTYKSENRKTAFVFPFDRFMDVCEILHENYNLYVFSSVIGKNYRSKGYVNAKSVYYINVDNLLYKGFVTKDFGYTRKAIDTLGGWFRKENVKLIIIGNDWTFIERAIAIAGRLNDIPVVVLQHGIYPKADFDEIGMEFGKYADHFWCWSGYTYDCFRKAFYREDGFLKIVGYPFFAEKKPIVNHKRVLFAGTPYSFDRMEMMDGYVEIIKTVINACNELGLDFSLRIHPGEDRRYYNKLFNGIRGYTLSDEPDMTVDVINSALVVGDLTSVLLQAAVLHRKAVRIMWSNMVLKYSDDVLYKSAVKVSGDLESIKRAIQENVDVFNSDSVDYEIGEVGVFKANILREANLLMK